MGGSLVNKIHMGGNSVIIEILGGKLVNCLKVIHELQDKNAQSSILCH